MTCTVTGATAGETEEVDAELTGPNDPDGGFSPTSPDFTEVCTADGGGTCTVTFEWPATGDAAPGQDELTAWIDDDERNDTTDFDQTEGPNAGATDAGQGATGPTEAGTGTEPDDTDAVVKNWFTDVPANAVLDCDPETATNPATGDGSSETYTCTLTDTRGNANPNDDVAVSGVRIDGENYGTANDPDAGAAGPTADYNDCGTTNAQGVATCTITSSESQAGTAVICFWADGDTDNQFVGAGDPNDGGECNAEVLGADDPDNSDGNQTDKVEKTWQARGQAARLVLTPESDQNVEGTSHTVTATVTDAFGDPVQGVEVEFDVSGRNNTSCDDRVTNAQGQTTCTYTDTGADIPAGGAGQADDIHAFAESVSNNDIEDAGEPDDDATKFWFDQLPTAATVQIDMEPGFDLFFLGECGGNAFEQEAENQVGDEHEICAHVEDASGDPIPGETVTFNSTGVGQFWTDTNDDDVVDDNELSDSHTTTTDANGDAFATLYSEETGVQTVTATADAETSDAGTKTWTALDARNIDCSPNTAQNAPGTQHVVTCLVTDVYGNPVEGEFVDFTESGPGRIVSPTGTTPPEAETDANGEVEVVVETGTNETGTQNITGELEDDAGDTDTATDDDDECDLPAGETFEGRDDADAETAGNCEETVQKVWSTQVEPECSDGIDNDGDGFIDFPNDPGCENDVDNDETDPDVDPGPQRGPCQGFGFGTTTPIPDGDGAVVVGTPGDDVLTGTDGDDIICGLAGDDVISALAGHDQVVGNAGSDEIDGGTGKDHLNGNRGRDTIAGRGGNDILIGARGHDTLKGNRGIDTIRGEDGNDVLQGGKNEDTLIGGTGADTLRGWTGDDVLKGGRGHDILNGHRGFDICRGGAGTDVIRKCERVTN